MSLDSKKKKIYETKEFLEETGQESEEKARKVVTQYFREAQIAQEGQRAFFLEKLDSRRPYNDYNRLCAEITLFYIDELDLPKGLEYKVQYDTKGVLLFVHLGRKLFQRAFKSVREPVYDLNACSVFAQGIADLISNYKKNGRAFKPQQA